MVGVTEQRGGKKAAFVYIKVDGIILPRTSVIISHHITMALQPPFPAPRSNFWSAAHRNWHETGTLIGWVHDRYYACLPIKARALT